MKEITEEQFAEMMQSKQQQQLPSEWPPPVTPIKAPKQVPLEAVVKTLGAVLAMRLLLWLNTAAAATLWGLAMRGEHPDPLKLVAAGGYSLGVYIPMLLWRREV